ncbi:UNVERIFIED_CONTAM: hypothetical protein FKN15_037401 [Acipenser sinensis]
MRQTVKEMKDHMSSPMAQAMSDRKTRQALLGDSGAQRLGWSSGADKYTQLHTANSQYMEEQLSQQQLIAEQQDDQLELVSGSIRVLKNMSQRIGQELDEQDVQPPQPGSPAPCFTLASSASDTISPNRATIVHNQASSYGPSSLPRSAPQPLGERESTHTLFPTSPCHRHCLYLQ